MPFVFAHLIASWVEPQNILYIRALDRPALKKMPATKNGMALAQTVHALNECQKIAVFRLQVPLQPANFVVLTVGVIVSVLRMANSISGIHHGHALGEQERCHQIPLLLSSQGPNTGIVSWTFHPAIPTPVIVIAVAIVFAIRFVVFFVVTDQILQREAIMRRDEIDAGIGTPPAMCIEIARTRDAISEISHNSSVALPIRAHGIAVAIVPLRPTYGEIPDLIAAFSQVPGFRNQFYLREYRVLMDDVEKSAQSIDFMKFAGQRRGEIEPEAIHVHLQNPVAQAVHDQLQHARMLLVQRISCACVTFVVQSILRGG